MIEPLATIPVRPRRRLIERLAERRPILCSTFRELACKTCSDHAHYYGWDSTADLLLGIAGASVLANTSLDQDFQDWHRDHVDGGDFSKALRHCGDGRILVPAFGFLVFAGRVWDEAPCADGLSELGFRTERAYLVGTPTLLFFQGCLGSARPYESKHRSRWRPFEEWHGVSGHAFIAAVPLINAARMAENPCLKAALYACSMVPAWARIEHNSHYLSQSWLGWWLAYLACRAVDDTEREYEQLALAPVATPDMVGIGVVYER